MPHCSQIRLNCNLDESVGAKLIDDYITVFPDDARKGMIFLGKDAASYKPGNIKVDLKKAIIAGFEFFAAFSKPNSIFNYIQLLITSIFLIGKATKQKLSSIDSRIVYLLQSPFPFGMTPASTHRPLFCPPVICLPAASVCGCSHP